MYEYMNSTETREQFEQRCREIVNKRVKDLHEKMRVFLIDGIHDKYEDYFNNTLKINHYIYLTHRFAYIFHMFYKESFGEFLDMKKANPVIHRVARELALNYEKNKFDTNKFPPLLEDSLTSIKKADLASPLYEYLLEHNGELPPSFI